MSKSRSYLHKITGVVFFILFASGHTSLAQEIIMPERWKNAYSYARPIFRQDTLTICVLGDIMMHSEQIRNAHTDGSGYDFSSYFSLIGDEIKKADIAIANMEFTLAGEPYTGYPCFSAPDTLAGHLARCGFDVFLAANNHIFDKGAKGADRTIDIYRRLGESHGIRFTGIAGNESEMEENNPLMIRRKGIRIALLNFTYGTNSGLDTRWPKTNYIGERSKIARSLSKAEEEDADYIIALPHWGTEYTLSHSDSQEDFARWLVENGVDCIIGAHPHVIQDRDTIGTVPVAYSLGNAVSNMSAKNTQLGLMAIIRLVRYGNGDIRSLPTEFKYLWCSRPGGYNDRYVIIPVDEYIGRKAEWKNGSDYDKMKTTYERVRKETEHK